MRFRARFAAPDWLNGAVLTDAIGRLAGGFGATALYSCGGGMATDI